MAAKISLIHIFSLLIIIFTFTIPAAIAAELDGHGMNETLEWQFQSQFNLEPEIVVEEEEDEEEEGDGALHRRSLYWSSPSTAPKRYYISYGALSANRIPCPARSGRSYFTHNCFRARGPVHPYTRGCSAITRCRR
ncbi:hypothetical protein ABFX02_14G259400 [Erythranthe guttata]